MNDADRRRSWTVAVQRVDAAGYPIAAVAFRAYGATAVPIEVKHGPDVVRLRHALPSEGPAGAVVAELVRADGSSARL